MFVEVEDINSRSTLWRAESQNEELDAILQGTSRCGRIVSKKVT